LSITVSIIEDDSNVRTILTDWITRAEGFELVSQYPSADKALSKLPEDKPEVILVDINLCGESGIACVRELKPSLPESQFLMLTVFEDGDHIFDALTAGASGYLLKRTPREELLAAIREVHSGGSPMTSYIARRVVSFFQKQTPSPLSGLEQLTAREKEILGLLAQGFAYKEMADALQISIGTINTHVLRIYQKLHVSSRGEAVAKFVPLRGLPQIKQKKT